MDTTPATTSTRQYVIPEGAPPPNTPPTASNVIITLNGMLRRPIRSRVVMTFSDADGDAEGSTVRWFIDGIQFLQQQRKDNWGSSTSNSQV